MGKKILGALVVVLLVGVGVLVVLQQQGTIDLPLPLPQREDPNETAFESFPLSRGSIASTVSATGNIEPEAELSLSFDTNGRVLQVLASAGQAVREGQLLAQLDVESFRLARDEALVGQKIAQSKLNKLLTETEQGDLDLAEANIAVAQAQIASAQANLTARRAEYNALVSGMSTADRAVMEAELAQAEFNEEEARYNLASTRDQYGVSDEEIEAAEARKNQAVFSAKAARSRLESAVAPPTEAELTAALHQIAVANEALRQANASLIERQNALRDLQEGSDVEDIDIARSELEQARINYAMAELNIRNAQLLAPRDGVISTVNVRVGEQLSGGAPAMILTDLQSYHMTVFVDEIDVRQVQVGQGVKLNLDALPDDEVYGKVTKISPTANEIGSTITYEVEIVPDATDAPLRAGMSATASITTAQVDNVLLIPNRYVRFDREQNKYFVFKVVNQEPVLAEINVGLRNERESQILAGLNDNDMVAVLSVDREAQLRNAIFGG